MKTVAILNPQSGRGRAIEIWNDVQLRLEGQFGSIAVVDDLATSSASLRIKELLQKDFRRFIIFGGDGTIHHFVNLITPHLLEGDQSEPIELGVISTGTGCDFSRSLGSKIDTKSEINRLLSGKTIPLDIGVARLDGGEKTYYINSASMGLGGQALRAQRSWKTSKMPRSLSYVVPGTMTFFQYKGADLIVSVNGEDIYEGPCLGVMVYNGQYAGGGMPWGHQASLSDGLLDVILKRPVANFRLPLAFANLFTKRIQKMREIDYHHARTVNVQVAHDGDPPIPLELDGEPHSARKINFSLKQGLFKVFS